MLPLLRSLLFLPSWLMLFLGSLPAAEPTPAIKEPAKPPVEKSVQELAKDLRPSIVVVTSQGRDGRKDALGTGFIVDSQGVIATNLHVIGEGRTVSVEMADGKKYDVVAVYATDRARDLALIKIDAKNLPAIPLGDSDTVKDGQPVVVLGNPQGLKFSVVNGVVSGRREIEGTSMIQIAVPVEQGNSGGPLLDMTGKVLGIVSLKSLVTANLGFAMPVNVLKPMIAKPNPITMEHWVTIGALDPEDWKPIMGGNWRQRAGRISVGGAGTGFGGRAICLNQNVVPDLPYEVTVTVKLEDERGAAGLIFHHDGDRHYGFYPTGGKLRLTRFDGPDVFSWKILEEKASEHYKPGEWNHLKVQVSKSGLKCYVNDQLVIESEDAVWTQGKAGLAKFRDSKAEFRHFQTAKKIQPRKLDQQTIQGILSKIDGLSPKGPVDSGLITGLTKQKGSSTVLLNRAKELENQAKQLRELAASVHEQGIYEKIADLLAKDDAKNDLLQAGLLLAKLDNQEIDVEAYRDEVNRMGKRILASLPKDADEATKLNALNRFFFEQRGFHGSRSDYYNRSNSYLNEVLDDREGLPITLSVLYMELGNRIGLKLVGIGAPGHFVVRHIPAKGEGLFIDVYEGGKTSTFDEMKKQIVANGYTYRAAQLEPLGKKQIVTRMLYNLMRVSREENDTESGLRYINGILILDPSAAEERFTRSVLRFSKGMKQEALEDVDYLLEHSAEDAPEHKRLFELKRMLERDLQEK